MKQSLLVEAVIGDHLGLGRSIRPGLWGLPVGASNGPKQATKWNTSGVSPKSNEIWPTQGDFDPTLNLRAWKECGLSHFPVAVTDLPASGNGSPCT